MNILNTNPFTYFIQQTNLIGTIKSVDSNNAFFNLSLRSGDTVKVNVKIEAQFSVLTNLDGSTNDQFFIREDSLKCKMDTYLIPNTLIAIEATLQKTNKQTYIGADVIHILINPKKELLFEQSEWWINQISRMADEWLDDIFGDNREYTQEDFAQLYRTNLNTYGLQTDETIQETATLSRLIYGLSSAYHITGCTRYLDAAKAGVEFQRTSFKNVKSDGESCFWAFGRRRQKYGTEFILLSENPDDLGTIPLYEQIYAIAGLAQYYRITADPHALEDIRRTVSAFNKFYLDKKSTNPEFPGLGGYFSHLDHASLRPDIDTLGVNKSRKNWNSIGDHIPAYLINILLALKPLPSSLKSDITIVQFVEICENMFDECIDNIIQYFPDKNPQIPYVNERFYEDWKPDHEWGWQQNRAIVGHNLKIAWNLTRAANYYEQISQPLKAIPAMKLAEQLADSMATYAVDPLHGGCFDAIERKPKNDMPLDMVWKSTKDFWQQEQCILAYLILYGKTKNANYLELARETLAFWNLYFLDRDNRGVFFRVSDIGSPIMAGSYGNKAGHAVAGYHSFELNFLANLYMRTAGLTNIGKIQNDIFNTKGNSQRDCKFCLYFKLHTDSTCDTINVRPDYTTHNQLSISGIAIDGVVKAVIDPSNFQISIPSGAQELIVQYKIGEE